MIRHLRGAWARRRLLLPLLLLVTVVVAGTVCVLGFARAAGTSRALVVPLLVLGAVAVPVAGRELAAARRGEIALARLRGMEPGALAAMLLVEPFLVLLLGGVLGLAVGAAAADLASGTFVEAGVAGVSVGLGALLAGTAIVAVGVAAVLAGTVGSLREPLADQVSLAARPRRSGALAAFGTVLVVVAAAVAVYRGSAGGAEEPDWLVLAGPALVGLASGQLAVWVVGWLARAAVRRTGSFRLPAFLALRRLARVADAAHPLRLLVAAAVVAALALTGSLQVDDWAEDAGRLRAAAPVRVPMPDADAADAVELTRGLDPEGRWLMAAVLVPGEGSVPARRAFLDTERYDAVVGDFLEGTPAGAAGEEISGLGTGAPATAVGTGGRLRFTVAGVSAREEGRMLPVVRVGYLDPTGTLSFASVQLEIGRSGAPVTVTRPLRGCEEGGCSVEQIVLGRSPGSTLLPYVLTGLELGGTDLLDIDWQPEFEDTDFGRPGGPVRVDNGLLARSTPEPLVAVLPETGPALPVLATASASWAGPPTVDSPGGDDRPADVVGRADALPLVEADGVVADLPWALTGALPTVPAAEVMVLAAADTPEEVLGEVEEAAAAERVTAAGVQRRIAADADAAQARVYGLMAGLCLLVALLVLGAAVARSRPAWRRDAAALRAGGVAVEAVRRAGWVEAVVLAATAVIATVLGGLVAVRLLLAQLDLVHRPQHALPLVPGLEPLPLLLAVGVAGLVVLVVAARGRVVPPAATRPAMLREGTDR